MPGYDKIVATEFGGPEVLKLEHFDSLPEPGPNEVRLRVEAAGAGYTDTILRRGRYIAYKGGLPLTPGYDVVGIVDKTGPDVTSVAVGARVADMPVFGSYSQFMLRPADTLIPVPDGIAPEAAVELPLMWMTAWQLLTRTASLKPGDKILAVSASGAVGRALVLLGRHLGLTVIGTCSPASFEFVKSLGGIPVDYRSENLTGAISAATGGAGVAAAFDAMGGESWGASWQSLAPGGVLVGYGLQDFLDSNAPTEAALRWLGKINKEWNAEGAADGTARSCQYYDIAARRGTHAAEYLTDAGHLFTLMQQGILPPEAEILPLAKAAEAHRRIAEGGLRHRLVLRP